jgi:G3E family GTPase
MPAVTRVYLITGFLGSGKTTLLNRIIDRFPQERKLTILMNEFGEIGIDGTLVEGEDIDMLEISRGSIFCVCVKTDFIKGLYELSTSVKPDVLIIESTGVANPSDLKRDLLLPIFEGRFHFQEQFCTIDAEHFLGAYETYASLEKQIASSGVFIINKTDLAEATDLEEIRAVIGQNHPSPVIMETTFSQIPLEPYFPDLAPEQAFAGTDATTSIIMSEDELDKYVEDLLDNPELEITPPDQLMSASYVWNGTDLDEVRDMAALLPPAMVRSKGFVGANNKWSIFSYVMGTWTLERTPVAEDRIKNKNTLVFIGSLEAIAELEQTLHQGNWIKRGTLQPFAGWEPSSSA